MECWGLRAVGVCRSGTVFFSSFSEWWGWSCSSLHLSSWKRLQQQGGGGYAGGRERGRQGEWRGSQRAASLTLRQEFSLLQLPVQQHTERAGGRKGTGPVDITAMTSSSDRVDYTLDVGAQSWWHKFLQYRLVFCPVPKCCHWAKCTPERSPGVVTTTWVLRYEFEICLHSSFTVTFWKLLSLSVCFCMF